MQNLLTTPFSPCIGGVATFIIKWNLPAIFLSGRRIRIMGTSIPPAIGANAFSFSPSPSYGIISTRHFRWVPGSICTIILIRRMTDFRSIPRPRSAASSDRTPHRRFAPVSPTSSSRNKRPGSSPIPCIWKKTGRSSPALYAPL